MNRTQKRTQRRIRRALAQARIVQDQLRSTLVQELDNSASLARANAALERRLKAQELEDQGLVAVLWCEPECKPGVRIFMVAAAVIERQRAELKGRK